MQSQNSLSFKADKDKINAKMSRAGFFTLLSSDEKFSSAEVLKTYRKKDGIEKNFYQIKNNLDFKRLKTHSKKTTQGKTFTGFVALILRLYLSKKFENHENLKKLTVDKIQRELKKIF